MSQPEQNPSTNNHSEWLTTLVSLPRHIAQPFSLAALALVSGVILGIFGPLVASLGCIGISVVLLAIGIVRVPRPTPGSPLRRDSYQSVSDLSSNTPVENTKAIRDGPHGLTALETLCFLHLYQLEGGSVGRNQIFPVNYFVDLMTASLVPDHLEVMVKELVTHIKRSPALNGLTTIAAPKRGNSLLLAAAAAKLGVQPVFVKERPLFGKMIEGIGGRPKKAAVVDDISSDGELLVTCVEVMRDHGYEITTAFVLIDRPEGDSVDALATVGVTLLPLTQLRDQDLESIAERGRRTRTP